MSLLSTHYMGLKLKSPLIIGSSSLTSSLSRMKTAEESGAGAIVMKSLFEEQINFSIASSADTSGYPESDDYLSYYTKSHAVDEYLSLIESAKKTIGIPIIPSINCISSETWIDFARNIQNAGADALEVNMFFLPVSSKISSEHSEKVYLDLIEKLKVTISIPFAIKIGQRFSNILYMIEQFYNRGVNGVVMFNRFYEPDIDIDNMSIVPSAVFSNPDDRRHVLRWIGMASALKLKIDISASTGVHSGADAIRYLLTGADTVQVCSALYTRGIQYLKTMNKEVEDWMRKMAYNTVDDFRGKLNYSAIERPSTFERTQFMKYFSSYD